MPIRLRFQLSLISAIIAFGPGMIAAQDINAAAMEKSVEIAADPPTGSAPLRVMFSPLLKNMFEPLRFEWAFGDGSTSEDRIPPVHSYEPGRYTAVLTVTARDAQVFTASRTIAVDYPCG